MSLRPLRSANLSAGVERCEVGADKNVLSCRSAQTPCSRLIEHEHEHAHAHEHERRETKDGGRETWNDLANPQRLGFRTWNDLGISPPIEVWDMEACPQSQSPEGGGYPGTSAKPSVSGLGRSIDLREG